MTEFEKTSIENALQRLIESNVIDTNQKEKLIEIYKNDNRPYSDIHEEIYKLRYDKSLLEKTLNSNITIADEIVNDVNTIEKEETHLNLENIEEFKKEENGITYIKIHYPYPEDRVEMVEKGPSMQNYTAKEVFTEIQTKYNADNATNLFKDVLKERCREIRAEDIDEFCKQTEFEKLTVEQKKAIIAIKRKPEYKDKKVTASPEEGIFVISEPNDATKDKVVTVIKKVINGKNEYVISPIQQNGYKFESLEDYEKQEDEEFFPEMDGNEEIEKAKDPEELGNPYVKRRKPNSKRELAFVNMLWFVILIGIICAIAIAALLTKFYY